LIPKRLSKRAAGHRGFSRALYSATGASIDLLIQRQQFGIGFA